MSLRPIARADRMLVHTNRPLVFSAGFLGPGLGAHAPAAHERTEGSLLVHLRTDWMALGGHFPS